MSRISCLVILPLFFLTACGGAGTPPLEATPTIPEGLYRYQVGLGYGFLGKHVQVSVDEVEVLSIVGTKEIEDFAQLLGTKILGGGSTDNQMITVRVVVDGGEPLEQVIDLEEGGIIHVYYQADGLQVFNTSILILE